jgi:hypothetical protein
MYSAQFPMGKSSHAGTIVGARTRTEMRYAHSEV